MIVAKIANLADGIEADGNVRVIDSSDDDCVHDVVMSYTEAVELFEDMTDIAVL